LLLSANTRETGLSLSGIANGEFTHDAFPIGNEHEDSFVRELNWYTGILGRMKSTINRTECSEVTMGEASVFGFKILARLPERPCTQEI
jgi:hypothetical protein